jgi:hypothetical protein
MAAWGTNSERGWEKAGGMGRERGGNRTLQSGRQEAVSCPCARLSQSAATEAGGQNSGFEVICFESSSPTSTVLPWSKEILEHQSQVKFCIQSDCWHLRWLTLGFGTSSESPFLSSEESSEEDSSLRCWTRRESCRRRSSST